MSRMVAVARHAAARELAAWGVEEDDAEGVALVVSELVTNAVRHGRVPGRLVELRLEYDREKAIAVEVSDARSRFPDPSAPPARHDPLAESGRGLPLVAALADEWGVRDRVVGKTVWARLLIRNSGFRAVGPPCTGRS